MTSDAQRYQRILFPDRAEYLQERAYQGYRVFLDFWDPLAEQLRAFYEGLAVRRDSRALVVYGPQGSGKTLFARKLHDDFKQAQEHVAAGQAFTPSKNNLWHRVSGGPALDRTLIAQAAATTEVLSIENDTRWVARARDWAKNNQNRRCVILVDNAERQYFLQGLLEMEDAAFLALPRNDARTLALASERFVALCRHELRGCLFVLLTNNDLFALGLDESVNAQHQGLLTVKPLPLPGSQEKETVVRVNTNRLNEISYWFCLDKAGPEEKMAVYTALRGASTFPQSFAAVDNAIRNASPTRMGRPARMCILTLVVLTDADAVTAAQFVGIGSSGREEFSHKWLAVHVFDDGWARPLIESGGGLLESEWQLRVAALGRPFVNALLSDDNATLEKCSDLLKVLERIHGPGSRESTREATRHELRTLIDGWPAAAAVPAGFWPQGQTRAVAYEGALRRVYPSYNIGHATFLTCRPDYIVSPYAPCSILAAQSGNIDHINDAIRREAHVFEFTAVKDFSSDAVKTYLRGKLPNYVDVVREQ